MTAIGGTYPDDAQQAAGLKPLRRRAPERQSNWREAASGFKPLRRRTPLPFVEGSQTPSREKVGRPGHKRGGGVRLGAGLEFFVP